MRVKNHPILEDELNEQWVSIKVNGTEIQAKIGEPISAALLAAGIKVLRYTSKYKHPRGIYCAIGRCSDCLMTVDGRPNVRTCVTPVKEGMEITTNHNKEEDI